jgi:hypothetical protein
MDLSVLASTVVTALAPYFLKTAEAFPSEAGKQALGEAKTLYQKIQQRLTGVSARKLGEFAEDPEGKAEGFKTALEVTLENDPAFVKELEQLLQENAPVVQILQRMDVAKRVTGADIETMKDASLVVEQDMRQAEDVTGARI